VRGGVLRTLPVGRFSAGAGRAELAAVLFAAAKLRARTGGADTVLPGIAACAVGLMPG
jgi:hypothetical protein